MTRRAAAAVTGPPHGAPSRVPPGPGRPGQMLSGTPGPVPPAARPGAAVASGAGPAWPSPAGVEGLCHGGWSRVPPLSALTLQKSGFRGLFSPARRRNIRAARITGRKSRRRNFPGFPGVGCGPLPHGRVPGVYLRCTSRRAAQVSAPDVPGCRRTGRAGRVAGGPEAASAGTSQVHGRYMPGARRAGARYIAGTCQVDRGWPDGASFPSVSLTWSFRMYDHSASPEPFDAADAAFRLLCAGPQPLAVHASKIAAGLPDRPVPLDELRVLLLHPSTGARARNQVWAELVRRARAGDPAWVIGLAGIAMPGLRRAAGSLAAAYRGDPADLQAEVLTGFLAAVHALDPDDLESVPLASRLCWAAWRAGQQHACADAGWASPPPRPGRVARRPGPALGAPGLRARRRRPPGDPHPRPGPSHRPEPARRRPAVADRRRDRDQPFRPVQPAEKGRESHRRRHQERIPRGLISPARVKKGAGNRISVDAGVSRPGPNSRGGRPARRGAAAAADSRPFPFPKEVRSRARRAGRPRTLHPALVPAGGTCP